LIDGKTEAIDVAHGRWFLSEQDCDLSQTLEDDSEKLFELRAIRSHGGDVPSAITGAKARIDRTTCLVAMDLSTKVTARWLTVNVANRTVIPPERRAAIKTWLGFRYDRPAVPDEFTSAHRRLLALAKQERRDFNFTPLRDVFVGYERSATAGEAVANIYAVLEDDSGVAAAQSWLARIRDTVSPTESFIVGEVVAAAIQDTPLNLPEIAFSLYADRHSLATATD
jgi:hypothetical protein